MTESVGKLRLRYWATGLFLFDFYSLFIFILFCFIGGSLLHKCCIGYCNLLASVLSVDK
uniref:Uncharacterized protein n=1 Tax=Anguilla anguilla TaxID=7936 RepID=A0A0E9V5L4_ANGAN